MAFLVLNETLGKKTSKLWGTNGIDLRISAINVYFRDTRRPTVGIRQGGLRKGQQEPLTGGNVVLVRTAPWSHLPEDMRAM